MPASVGQTPALGRGAEACPRRNFVPSRLREGTTMIGRAVASAADFGYAAALVRLPREATALWTAPLDEYPRLPEDLAPGIAMTSRRPARSRRASGLDRGGARWPCPRSDAVRLGTQVAIAALPHGGPRRRRVLLPSQPGRRRSRGRGRTRAGRGAGGDRRRRSWHPARAHRGGRHHARPPGRGHRPAHFRPGRRDRVPPGRAGRGGRGARAPRRRGGAGGGRRGGGGAARGRAGVGTGQEAAVEQHRRPGDRGRAPGGLYRRQRARRCAPASGWPIAPSERRSRA